MKPKITFSPLTYLLGENELVHPFGVFSQEKTLPVSRDTFTKLSLSNLMTYCESGVERQIFD